MAQLRMPESVVAHRLDIDGLRAVAILSVIAYHAFPHTVPGGFIGVDIFFVISGYLISGIIYSDLRRGRFSYANFYARRFRRIFPALAAVLFACLLYGLFALAPDQYRELGRQVAAGAGFCANILFWRESGYFDVGAGLKPLLHLWSLGVEEQFYLAWPAVIVLTYGRSTRLVYVTASVLLGSFCATVALTHTDPTAAFYLPVTRFWELLLGALLAYRTALGRELSTPGSAVADLDSRRTPRLTAADFVASVGLVLMAASLWLINGQRSFPGWWALLPTVSTALMIAAPAAWLNRKVLSNRFLVFIGLISYPLYLWHWVLLSFARIAKFGDEPPRSWRLAAIASAFALAWLTYRLVEKPIRFSPKRGTIPRTVIATLAVCGVLGALVYATDGGAFRYPAQIRPLAAARYDLESDYYEDAYRGGACFLGPTDGFSDIGSRCVDKPNGGERLLVLWGDSHAASLYPGLRAMQSRSNFGVAQFTASACPPILGLQRASRPNCHSFNEAVIAQVRKLKPWVVILEAHWALYGEGSSSAEFNSSALGRTIQALEHIGPARIVVMGSLPSWKIYQPRVAFEIWRREHVLQIRSSQLLDRTAFDADNVIREAVSGTGATFVSPIQLLCNRDGCLISADPTGATPIAWDYDHLSLAGSAFVARLALPSILGEQSQPSPGSLPSAIGGGRDQQTSARTSAAADRATSNDAR
jgi:peptidoglycan/LPS O-acetylase OafA/YrhL